MSQEKKGITHIATWVALPPSAQRGVVVYLRRSGGSIQAAAADALEGIAEFPPELFATLPRWIPVEERLPPPTEPVLVCGPDLPPTLGWYAGDSLGGAWRLFNGPSAHTVTHWFVWPAAPYA